MRRSAMAGAKLAGFDDRDSDIVMSDSPWPSRINIDRLMHRGMDTWGSSLAASRKLA